MTIDSLARTALRALTLTMLLPVLLAGCGGSSDGSSPSDAPSTPTPPPSGNGPPPLDPNVVSLDDHHQVGSTYWQPGNMPDGGQGSSVEGLDCIYPSPIDYHVHSHMSIFMDGEALAVPEEVGIVQLSPTTDCHYPIHTHDATGMIHLHATAPTDFTLGQFFAIWGQPLARDDVGGLVGLPVVVYLTDDGVVTEYTGDLAALKFASHREITIQIGTPITSIPQFDWTGP